MGLGAGVIAKFTADGTLLQVAIERATAMAGGQQDPEAGAFMAQAARGVPTLWAVLLFAALGAVCLFLGWRPRWWGKIVGLLGLNWAFSAVFPVVTDPVWLTQWIMAGIGWFFVGSAVIHHLLDPDLGDLLRRQAQATPT